MYLLGYLSEFVSVQFQSVRRDNSSVHVQGSYGQYESSSLQTELIDEMSWLVSSCRLQISENA
jgi:hypothetical protein